MRAGPHLEGRRRSGADCRHRRRARPELTECGSRGTTTSTTSHRSSRPFHPALSALDIGCGEGLLTRKLRRVVPQVTGIDLDIPSLELARGRGDDLLFRYSITWQRLA
ncbi:methyltransferase domain-containing protein [Kribbella sp. VKM Ac-2571]|uniref:methyltransferase domain-containing protein n=1 Tax=Kribbella sp. VKM Ac-2571 TaxID=2512222 RepID=UPI00192D9D8A